LIFADAFLEKKVLIIERVDEIFEAVYVQIDFLGDLTMETPLINSLWSMQAVMTISRTFQPDKVLGLRTARFPFALLGCAKLS